MAVVALIFVVGIYHSKTEADATRREIAKLKQQIALQESEIGMLQTKLSGLDVPGRVGEIARERLGLQPVLPDRSITLQLSASETPASASADGATSRTEDGAPTP
jgi:cell division protein FtsL